MLLLIIYRAVQYIVITVFNHRINYYLSSCYHSIFIIILIKDMIQILGFWHSSLCSSVHGSGKSFLRVWKQIILKTIFSEVQIVFQLSYSYYYLIIQFKNFEKYLKGEKNIQLYKSSYRLKVGGKNMVKILHSTQNL